jgi:choline dehydrogenase-like flavoprotein
LALLLLALTCGAAKHTSLRATHDALFSSFLPLEDVQNDARIGQMLTVARDRMWIAGSNAPEFEQMLAAFRDLRSVKNLCGIRQYRKNESDAFSNLTPAQRQHVLFLLQSCSANEARRLAMTARNFYVATVYGMLQQQLAGVDLKLYAPASYVERHQPDLPPSRLRYDAGRKEVSRTDGPIDYLIVGSGPAGSVLAHELRRDGRRVLLVERGSFVVPGSMETREISGLVDRRSSEDGGILIQNGMTAGGGSQVNIDLCFAPTMPSIQAKIENWRSEGRIGQSDFTKSQIATAYEWVKASIGTRVLQESEINANNRVLWEGAKRAGFHPKLYDLNTYPPGLSPYAVTDKRSAETQLIIPALQDTNNPLSLLSDADVRRVLFEEEGAKKKAIGVEVRIRRPLSETGVVADLNGLKIPPKTTIRIRARTVVLSAGALGSPTILLRSGVQNDQIGRGVILHVSMPIIGRFDQVIDALQGTRASVFVDDALVKDGYALESMSAEPVYAALMSPGPAMHVFELVKSYRHLAGFGVMLVDTPSPLNRLTLDARQEARIEYTLSESDKRRFRRGISEAIQIMFMAGAKQVYLPTTENILGTDGKEAGALHPVVLTDIQQAALANRLKFVPNRTILTSAHMQATDKMGQSRSNSVVSQDFKVWGTEQLYIVDASIFPTSIGANPMQSVYTFAKIFAERMNAQDLFN